MSIKKEYLLWIIIFAVFVSTLLIIIPITIQYKQEPRTTPSSNVQPPSMVSIGGIIEEESTFYIVDINVGPMVGGNSPYYLKDQQSSTKYYLLNSDGKFCTVFDLIKIGWENLSVDHFEVTGFAGFGVYQCYMYSAGGTTLEQLNTLTVVNGTKTR